MIKKYFLISLLIVLCSAMLSCVSYADENLSEYTLIKNLASTDYEKGNLNTGDYIYYASSTKGGYGLSVVEDDGEHGNVLKLAIKSETISYNDEDVTISNATWQLNYPGNSLAASVSGGEVVIEYDIKFENFLASNRLICINAESGSFCLGPLVSNTGKLELMNGEVSDFALEENEWYNIRFIVDMDNKVIDFLLDGVVIEDNHELKDSFDKITYCIMPKFSGFGSQDYCVCYIDNVKIYNRGKNYVTTANAKLGNEIKDIAEGLPLNNSEIQLNFSEIMGEMSKDNFTFTANGENVVFDVVTLDDKKTVIVTPKVEFKGRETCVITFNGLKTLLGADAYGDTFIEFMVGAPDFGITGVSHEAFSAGETATLNVSVHNDNHEKKVAYIIIGMYDKLRLISIATVPFEVKENSTDDFAVNIPVPIDYNNDCAVYAYIADKETLFGYDLIKVE